MFRDKQEELSRLEDALLQAEQEPEIEEVPPAPVEPVRAYSNVPCDVDLEEYEEAVQRQGPSLGLLTFFIAILTVAFCLVAWVVLKQRGYLG